MLNRKQMEHAKAHKGQRGTTCIVNCVCVCGGGGGVEVKKSISIRLAGASLKVNTYLICDIHPKLYT